jgi:acetyltransferase
LGVLQRYAHILARPVEEPSTPKEIDRDRARLAIDGAVEAGLNVLDPQAGAGVAKAYGLTLPHSGLAATADEAVQLAQEAGYPVALKLVAPGVIHKADRGGVALGLDDADAVKEAFARVVSGKDERAFVQSMAAQGLEVVVGAQRDPQFGPLLMFGLGGTYVEVLRDVAFRLAPLSETDAREMVAETAAGKLLAGVRGEPPRDIAAVVDAIQRIGHLMQDLPQVSEVDLNPLIVGQAGEGAWAVDVRIVIEKGDQ